MECLQKSNDIDMSVIFAREPFDAEASALINLRELWELNVMMSD